MNARIKELAEAAYREIACNSLDGVISREAVDQRFAELIVRECMDVVGTAVDQREPASTYVDLIEKHFGVEE